VAVTPYLLVNKSERERIEVCVRSALESWQAEWFPESLEATVVVMDDVPPPGAAERVWKSFQTVDGAGVSIGLPTDWERAAVTWMTGTRQAPAERGELASSVNEQLVRALVTALFRAAGKDGVKSPSVLESDEVRKNAADIVVQCVLGAEAELWFRLGPKTIDIWVANVAAPVAPRTALVPAREAVAGRAVSLRTFLGEAELTLNELQTLGVGDVIRLDRKLDQPLVVRLSDVSVCTGYLGTIGDRKAVQLAAKETPNCSL
jgi:hypothetical protein